MLYDSNAQQPNTPYTSSVSRTPGSAYIPKLRPLQMTTTFSNQSLGFHVPTDVIVHPTSERSMKSGDKQTTTYSTSRVLPPENITPSLFQPVSVSNQSTADYPLAASSIVNSSTYRTQMSHEQHMQAWRQEQVKKIMKKQRHCYVYDAPPQPTMVDRVSTAAILTPQVLSTATKQGQAPETPDTGQTQRGPTISPFHFPITSSEVRSAPSSIVNGIRLKTKNQKLKINRPQEGIPIPPERMDRLDEDPQEKSNTNKSSKITSALIQRKDSQSSVTDIKEV